MYTKNDKLGTRNKSAPRFVPHSVGVAKRGALSRKHTAFLKRLDSSAVSYAVNEEPQPHEPVAFGFLKAKP